jgi:hypothetical protein
MRFVTHGAGMVEATGGQLAEDRALCARPSR